MDHTAWISEDRRLAGQEEPVARRERTCWKKGEQTTAERSQYESVGLLNGDKRIQEFTHIFSNIPGLSVNKEPLLQSFRPQI
ncbi:hypothetical protein DPEC_G00180170 [Dallia pectoralis]|uniref:Uncharacterized protein n=1 Tax=Dallia pectoralis TaxID=75939 RepID=A0ACC2GA36_DALPE|nr:hypothetical protein DPEC_G00180170 [Dallia pectoralis]